MTKLFKNVSVIGLGYIGLPTAAALATTNMTVYGVDVNPKIVDKVSKGEIHIVEPELDKAVQRAVAQNKLIVSQHPRETDAYIIAVPTPFKGNYEPDLKYIDSAIESIANHLRAGSLIILESTLPVGSTALVEERLAQLRPDLSFPNFIRDVQQEPVYLAYCPERVLPGKIMFEIVNNDRIIGGVSEKCAELAKQLYKTFVKGECLVTNARTAEMCKLTENSFRDVNIAFANELSLICHEQNINVWELIKLANQHPRVNILQPGAGVGGHCIAVDPWFIVAQNPQQARLIRTAREVNDSKPKWVIEQVKAAVAECAMLHDCKPSKLTIACLGVAFKADVDDLRESPALAISKELSHWHQGETLVVEPNIEHLPDSLSSVARLTSLEQAIAEADVVVLLVAHTPFKQLMLPAEFSNSADNIQKKFIVDTCGIWCK